MIAFQQPQALAYSANIGQVLIQKYFEAGGEELFLRLPTFTTQPRAYQVRLQVRGLLDDPGEPLVLGGDALPRRVLKSETTVARSPDLSSKSGFIR